MLSVVLGAIRARKAQSASLFVLTALAVAAATAAPWYVVAAARSVALADVAGAAATQRVIRTTGIVAAGPHADGRELVQTVRDEARAQVAVPGATATVSLRLTGRAAGTQGEKPLSLVYREEMCRNVAVEGACPTGPGEAMVSGRTAAQLRVRPGDRVTFELRGRPGTELRVVGVYRLLDPLGPYWAGTEAGAGRVSEAGAGDPLFVAAQTLAAVGAEELLADYHLVLPVQAYLGDGGYDLAAELTRQSATVSDRWRFETAADSLAQRVAREQRLVNLGVAVAAAQLLVLCWFALFFVLRRTADQRRPDIGLLKLRGAERWRVWSLTVQQSLLPMLAGALAGTGAGFAVVRLLAGGIVDPDRARSAVMLSLVTAGGAVLGAVVAAVAAEGRAMGDAVQDLLRHVPPRRRFRRADALDLIVLVVAVAGLYQAYVTEAGPGETSGLVLVAPALVALAVALVAGRAVKPLAARAAARALRAGRLPLALAATHLARRPGTHRVIALLAVATALLATAVATWETAADARDDRAVHEVGAARVLTVQARSRAHLLAAVRAADPQGRHAMAVVRADIGGGGQVVLAVDSARFARVAAWQSGYASEPAAELAARLRSPAPAPVLIADGELVLDAAPATADPPVVVVADLVTSEGDETTVAFGPLAAGRRTYRSPLTGCGADGGCRLVGFQLARPVSRARSDAAAPVATELAEAAAGDAVHLYGLSGVAGPLLSGTDFGDAARWRGTVRADAVAATIAARDGRLTVTAPGEAPGRQPVATAYLVDAPVPVPVVDVGTGFAQTKPGDPRLPIFGGEELPVRSVGVARVLPQAPRHAYLVDLELADRLAAPVGAGDVPQVWLGPHAPADLLDRLRARGLVVLSDKSITATRDRYARQAPPMALRFQLLAGVIGLLLAAGALTVAAAVERPERSAELAALRGQGMSLRAVRWIAYGGYAVLVVAGVLVGVAAGALARALLQNAVPVFVDNWRVLPPYTGLAPLPLALTALAALVVLGATGAVAAAQLVRAVRANGRAAP